MSDLKSVIPLFVILFICTLDGYSMMNYRLPAKRSYICFFAVTALCLAVNSLIVMYYGEAVLRNVIIFTIGLPYFFLILFITKDKISQTVFNFWLWINVYAVIDGISAFINDFVFRDYMFYTALRFVLLSVYYVLFYFFTGDKNNVRFLPSRTAFLSAAPTPAQPASNLSSTA